MLLRLPYTCASVFVVLVGCAAAVSWPREPDPVIPVLQVRSQPTSPAPLPRPALLSIASPALLTAPSEPEIAPVALPAPPARFQEDWWLPIRVESTGYCPCRRCCGRDADGTVAWHPNGRKRRTRDHPWGIAADPRILPYGTRISVPNQEGVSDYDPSVRYPDDHAWTVDDTGGDMRRAWSAGRIAIDLRFIHHRSGDRYGRHWRTVYVDTRTLTPRQITRLERFRDHDAAPYILARR